MPVIKGRFGNEEPEKASAQDILEAMAEALDANADVIVVALDDVGVSLGSNASGVADMVLILELAKMSLLERLLEGEEGSNDTIH
jgi:hypothetical protein